MIRAFLAALLLSALLAGCDGMPGQPKKSEVVVAPNAVTNFEQLYMENCNGCHGITGNVAGSISMDDQTFLNLIPRETLQAVIAGGVPGTPMPAFSQANGGLLTDSQIDTLVNGILEWKNTAAPAGLPAYAGAPGNATAGASLYQSYVAGLQKTAPQTMFADGFMANPAFLGLSSDQYLRTLLIVGRPELGIPDFQSAIPGQPLSEQQIADIVAWLVSQRKNEFGQPLAPATTY